MGEDPRWTHIRNLLARCSYPGVTLVCGQPDPHPGLFVRVEADLFDNAVSDHALGEVRQNGRWWRLSRHMTDGEVVQTAFKAVLTFMEHETRESFKVDGLPVMQPHWSLEALVSMAQDRDQTQERPPA